MALKNQSAIGSPKTKIVFHRDLNGHVPSGVGAVVQIAFRIGRHQIDGGRAFLMMQGQDSEDTFNPTRATEQMPSHGLG